MIIITGQAATEAWNKARLLPFTTMCAKYAHDTNFKKPKPEDYNRRECRRLYFKGWSRERIMLHRGITREVYEEWIT